MIFYLLVLSSSFFSSSASSSGESPKRVSAGLHQKRGMNELSERGKVRFRCQPTPQGKHFNSQVCCCCCCWKW
ncbi:hypothetical protein F5Y17DRAFT_10828 [Xylariaceae sp. FL0594]|nr:hypothetical protein F5Y17DRAFT_10828 [Xylariaceae sp. FL0594]